LGGDEFALVLAVPGGVSDAVMVAERILARLHTPIIVDGVALTMRTSVGIAMSG
jgi:GGDEF domain-containing protein